MIDVFITFFDKNIMQRIITGLIFVFLFITAILIGGVYFNLFFLLILALILYEINISLTNNYFIKIVINTITILSLFNFIILRFVLGEYAVSYLLYIVFSIWIFDSFSLIGGKLLNGKKLFPKISPNKTYSGLISGFLSLFVISFIFLFSINLLKFELIILTMLIGLLAFIGDALESYFKRKLNIKDSGSLLPGHGGFLDRMDAFILIFFIHLLISLFGYNYLYLYV
jgi:phosphatidate cytidylyltransferase|tara:strand:- start:714 stop:1394 length:681 start_codon:yes stop_codon:yes gene_type:complete